MAHGMVNGLDSDKLDEVRGALRQNPDAAQFTFRAGNRWRDGANCYTWIQDFTVGGQEDRTRPYPFVYEAGEPFVLLGQNEGPNATEALLFALATCLNTTFMFYAATLGVKIDELELDMQGDLDLRGFLDVSKDVRNGFRGIDVTFRVKADGASEDQIRELCRLAQGHSPVFDMVTHETPVRAKVEIRGAEMPEEDVSIQKAA